MAETSSPPTVQTVQSEPDPRFKEPWIEIAEDAEGRFHWCLWTPNGRPVARSGIAYERRKDCVAAAKALARTAAQATRIVQITVEV